MTAEITAQERRSAEMRELGKQTQFKPGNPGRPKGSRNKLGEEFLSDLLADWQEHGAEAIVEVRETKPADYLKVVSSTIPKQLNVKVGELDELTDDQLARQLASVAKQLADAGISIIEGASKAKGTAEASGVPTLQ